MPQFEIVGTYFRIEAYFHRKRYPFERSNGTLRKHVNEPKICDAEMYTYLRHLANVSRRRTS